MRPDRESKPKLLAGIPYSTEIPVLASDPTDLSVQMWFNSTQRVFKIRSGDDIFVSQVYHYHSMLPDGDYELNEWNPAATEHFSRLNHGVENYDLNGITAPYFTDAGYERFTLTDPDLPDNEAITAIRLRMVADAPDDPQAIYNTNVKLYSVADDVVIFNYNLYFIGLTTSPTVLNSDWFDGLIIPAQSAKNLVLEIRAQSQASELNIYEVELEYQLGAVGPEVGISVSSASSESSSLSESSQSSQSSESSSSESSASSQMEGDWVSYFDNTYWQIDSAFPVGNWDGSKWNSEDDGGVQACLLEAIGTWKNGYKPTRVRITLTGVSNVNMYFVNLNEETIIGPDQLIHSGSEVTLTFPDAYDMAYMGWYLTGSSPFSITNIEFDNLGGSISSESSSESLSSESSSSQSSQSSSSSESSLSSESSPESPSSTSSQSSESSNSSESSSPSSESSNANPSIEELFYQLSEWDQGYTQNGTDLVGDFTDLHFGDAGGEDNEFFVRFTNVTIPQGANIDEAYIDFTESVYFHSSMNLYINGVDSDDVEDPPYNYSEFGSLVLTTAQVIWAYVYTATNGDTPDLKSIIQEIVNRPGWTPGGAIVLVFRDLDASGGLIYFNSFFETSGHPVLHVTHDGGSEAQIVEELVYADGEDREVYVSGADWATVQAATSGTVSSLLSYWRSEARLSGATYYVYRGFMFFDLSSSQIVDLYKAKLRLSFNGGQEPGAAVYSCVQESTAANPLVAGSYDDFTGSLLINQWLSFSDDARKAIEFNAGGLSYLAGVLGSLAKLVIRDYNYDYLNSSSGLDANIVQYFSSLVSNTARKPALVLRGSLTASSSSSESSPESPSSESSVSSESSESSNASPSSESSISSESSASALPTEDLTGFTEVDGNSRLSVSGSQVDFTALERQDIAYLYDDYGVDYFTNATEIDFEFQVQSGDNSCQVAVLSLANSIGTKADMNTNDDGFNVYLSLVGGNVFVYMRDEAAGSSGSLALGVAPPTATYYCTFDRSGTQGRVRVYSDAARTSLVGTIGYIGNNSDNFRYLYAAQSVNDIAWDYQITGYARNFIINSH